MQEDFELSHTVQDSARGRRDKDGVSGPRAADPVLASSKFAGFFIASASAGKEHVVNLTNEPKGERESLS